MKYLHLIWAALFRSKTRTFLTLLSVITAFLLFGMLDSVRMAFNASANVAGYDRLITHLAAVDHPVAAVPPAAADRAGARRGQGRRTRPGSAASTRIRRTSSPTSPSARATSTCTRNTIIPPDAVEGVLRHPRPAPSSARRWPSSTAGRSATRSRCRRRSSRPRAATTGPSTWSASSSWPTTAARAKKSS